MLVYFVIWNWRRICDRSHYYLSGRWRTQSHMFPFVIRSVIGNIHVLLNSFNSTTCFSPPQDAPCLLFPQDINNEFITWIFYYNSGFLLIMLMLREMHLLRDHLIPNLQNEHVLCVTSSCFVFLSDLREFHWNLHRSHFTLKSKGKNRKKVYMSNKPLL